MENISFALIHRKLTRTVYTDLLKSSLLPECCWLYLDNDFVFMQGSASSHHTKAMQQFLRQNTPNFIAADKLASYSPDLNPLDYCIRDILQDLVYEGWRLPFANLQDLKEAVKNEWKEVIIETERKSIAQWKKWLIVVRKQNGGAIQHIFH